MITTVLPEAKFTIQNILTDYFEDYLQSDSRRLRMTDHILKTVNQIRCCRTPRLGVYLVGCKCCGECKTIPRSCKNRFCSKCGTSDTMKWVKEISLKVPDIKHYHIVFTLPIALRIIAKRNQKIFYGLMFKSSQLAMKQVFAKKGNLQPGLISVLHTNGSDLKYHPHIHMIVSAGGFDPAKALVELTDDYLVPQRKLADLFRKLFLAELSKLLKSEQIKLPASLWDSEKQHKYFKQLWHQQWIVNIEDPLIGAEKIIAYVGRYTKKSCISERRLLEVKDGLVKMSYKDYKNSVRGEKPLDGVKTFTITEFLDRLLQHVPLPGLKVVRYYGMYASLNWKYIPAEKRIQRLNYDLAGEEECFPTIGEENVLSNYRRSLIRQTGVDPVYCYHCEREMDIIELHIRKANGQEVHIAYYDLTPHKVDDG